MRTLIALFVFAFLAAVNGQGCNVNNGSPVFINSTADLTTYGACPSLPGIIIGNGNLTGTISFDSLTAIRQTIGDTSTSISQTGIQILNTQLTGIAFPKLATFYGSFIRVINNPNLASLSVGPSTGFTNQFTGGGTQIVIQSNPNLQNPTITIDNLGTQARSIVTIGADGTDPNAPASGTQDLSGATGTVSLPLLTTALSLTIFSNGIATGTGKTLAVSLPAITSLPNGINAVNNTYLTSVTVGGNNQFGITNGGVAFVSNPALASLNLNAINSATGSINFASNGAAGTALVLQMDNLVFPQGSPSSIAISDNPGLTTLSFAKVQYPTISVNILRNSLLNNINLPGPFLTGSVQIDSNGINTPNGVTAVIGVYNATSGGVSFTSNKFASLAFPQAYYWSIATFTTNTFTGPFYANTTFYTQQGFSLTGGSSSTFSVLDLSGLASTNALTISNQGGANGASILLNQLQQVRGAGGITITGNTGFTSITFGKLVSTPGPLTLTTNSFNTFDFGSSATNNWVSGAISIDSSNNNALSTVNFGGLVSASTISISLNNGGTAASTQSTISANKLTCVNQFIVNSQNTGLNAVNLKGLVSYNAINVQGGSANCQVNVGASASTNCANGCNTCPNYPTGSAVTCGGNVQAQGISGSCAKTNNAQSDSGCGTASPYSFTTTSATPLNPPTPNNPGGQGTSTTATNTLTTSTVSNNGAATTTTTNNNNAGNGNKTTGAGFVVSASLLILAAAAALAL